MWTWGTCLHCLIMYRIEAKISRIWELPSWCHLEPASLQWLSGVELNPHQPIQEANWESVSAVNHDASSNNLIKSNLLEWSLEHTSVWQQPKMTETIFGKNWDFGTSDCGLWDELYCHTNWIHASIETMNSKMQRHTKMLWRSTELFLE